jgi:hypothetical protein
MDRPAELYSVIVNILFDSVRYARFEIFPYLLSLRQWFLSAPSIGTMSKPPSLLDNLRRPQNPNVDPDGLSKVDVLGITDIGQICHDAFHKRVDKALVFDSSLKRQEVGVKVTDQEFFDLIFSLPNRIATALTLKGTVFVLDHVDEASPEVARALGRVLQDSPFVVSCANCGRFGKTFKLKTVVEVGTEDVIPEEEESDAIEIQDLRLKIEMGGLGGRPGFVAAFLRIREKLEEVEAGRMGRQREGQIRSRVDRARSAEVAEEVKKLLLALAGVEGSGIEFEMVNEITANTEIRIVRKAGKA